MASMVVGPRSSKALPKATLTPEKGHRHSSVVCCPLIHYSFLNPGETITSEKYEQQVNEMHQKLQCLQLALVNRISPILLHNNNRSDVFQPMLPKLNKLCYKVLPHPPYSPDLSPIDQHFFKHLDNVLQGKCFHRNTRQKMLSKNLSNPEAWIFMLQE